MQNVSLKSLSRLLAPFMPPSFSEAKLDGNAAMSAEFVVVSYRLLVKKPKPADPNRNKMPAMLIAMKATTRIRVVWVELASVVINLFRGRHFSSTIR